MGGRGSSYDTAREIVDQYSLDRVTDSKNKIADLFRKWDQEGTVRLKTGEDGNPRVSIKRRAMNEAEDLARELSGRIVEKNQDAEQDFKDIRRQVTSAPIFMAKRDRDDIPDFGAYAKSSENFVRISNNGSTSVDQLYEDLSEQYPQYFSRSVYSPSERLQVINSVLAQLKNSRTTALPKSYQQEAIGDLRDYLVQAQARRLLNRSRRGKTR